MPTEVIQVEKINGTKLDLVDANDSEEKHGAKVAGSNKGSSDPMDPNFDYSLLLNTFMGGESMGADMMDDEGPSKPGMPSANPMSPNFSFEGVHQDFFGGSFFSQLLSRSNEDELRDLAGQIPTMT